MTEYVGVDAGVGSCGRRNLWKFFSDASIFSGNTKQGQQLGVRIE